jgi:phage terminase large subunit-like protein
VVRRTAKHREPTVMAVGRGGQIISGRYDAVIIDDVEDYNSTRTETRRLATYEWLQRDVMPVVVAGGSVWIIQTPQHEADLVGQLQKHRIWKMIRVPSETDVIPPVVGEINRVSTWPDKWPIYYRDCRVKRAESRGATDDRMAEIAADECHDCAIFNPSLGDTKGVGCLTGKRLVEVGSAFYELQYKVNVQALGGQFFHRRWFRTFRRSEIAREGSTWLYTPEGAVRPYNLRVFFGVDPAIADEGEKDPEHHSRFALVVLGYCHELRRRLILYDYADRLTWPEQLALIGEQALVWAPERVFIENNVYQKALVQHLETFAFPVQGFPADNDWFRRIAALTIFFQSGQVYVMEDEPDAAARAGVKKREDILRPKRVYSSAPYMHEFTMWPRGAHDDRCDATVAAFRGPAGQPGFGDWRPEVTQESDPRQNPHVILPVPGAGQPQPKLWTAHDLLNSLH